MQNPFLGAQGKADIVRRLPDGVASETVDDYIEDAWARAVAIVPVIAEDTWPSDPDKADQIKAILRGIILRWHEDQSGAVTGRTQSAGPYQQSVQLDQRPKRGYALMPSEIVDLQRVCKTKGGMFTINPFPDDDDSPRKTFANGPHPW